MENQNNNEVLREVYAQTSIVRKPISGIVSGYHQLPYILIAPNDENPSHTIEVDGKINVSPKFVISPSAFTETFESVFDPSTFDEDLEGRLFSFAFTRHKNIKLESEYFKLQNYEELPKEHLERVEEQLMQQENTRTGLIFSPKFQFYPVSIDRYISEILEREFRI